MLTIMNFKICKKEIAKAKALIAAKHLRDNVSEDNESYYWNTRADKRASIIATREYEACQ